MLNYFEGKRILVTGSAGIVGQNICKKLHSLGATLFVTEHSHRKLDIVSDNRIHRFKVDLMNIEELRKIMFYIEGQYGKIDIMVSCAAFIRGAKGQSNKNTQLELVRNNLILGINQITAAVEHGVGRFGFIGSSTMYPPVEYPVTEDEAFDGEPWKGYAGVGNMKRYLEKVCMYYHGMFDTKFAMARTTALYGPYDDFNPETCHVIPDKIVSVYKRYNPVEIFGDGTDKRNFIYVEDFVDGFLSVIEHHPFADPINITSDEMSTIDDVVNAAIEAANYNASINHIDGPRMIPYRVVSTEKAKKIIGWKAKTSLKEGIKKTYDWYFDKFNKGEKQ